MCKRSIAVFASLLLGLGVGPKAGAQSLPLGADTIAAPAVLPSLSSLRYGRSDTLRAVQHLFMQRSKAMRSWLEGGTAILLDGAVKKVVVAAQPTSQPEYKKDHYEDLDQQASQDIMVGTLMAGYGLFRLSRFGPRQYQRVVLAYQQGQPLPPYLARRLKTRYFRLLPIGSRQERAAAVRE